MNGEQDELQESNLRYAAYTNRLRTVLLASHRYVAYTLDIGESFRPVINPFVVTVGYAVSWAYLMTDVSYASWKIKMKAEGRWVPHLRPWENAPPADSAKAEKYLSEQQGLAERDWRVMFVKRGIFQSLASMALPAFTIHSAVKYSPPLFKNVKLAKIRGFGPVAVGLLIVPFLPYIYDEPIEHAVDYVFDKGEAWYTKLD